MSAAVWNDAVPEHFAAIEATWRPDPVEVTEFVTSAPTAALAGLFDQPAPATGVGDPLPPLWHWLHLLDRPAQAELGDDGHPRDGLFLPPLPDRRRMFGGGRLEFHAPIRIGDLLTRHSEVASVRVRHGGSGRLLLVTVRHTFLVDGEIRTVEEQDVVYKQNDASPAAVAPTKVAGTAAAQASAHPWEFTLTPDPPLLFRFSALTYNAHRIHYDHTYATEVEGYPGLVVHGPLLALALLELPRRFAPQRAVRSFAYRLRSPLFAPAPVLVHGTPQDAGAELGAGPLGGAPACTGDVVYTTPTEGPRRS